MADLNTLAALPCCPRCDTNQTELLARSPSPGIWKMFLCPVCFYSWRDTEPEEITTRRGIAIGFRIDPAKIPLGKEMPSVPSLREAKKD